LFVLRGPEEVKMAESLGEKLRKAREEREISISEVAEQTRISALYLQAIEKDDYGPLPGGIFNKGFIKSFAKYVGVDEGEALADYARIAAAQEAADGDKHLKYKPEVLTDDRFGPSLIPTIIFSVVILGLLAWGIMLLVNYLKAPASPTSGPPPAEENTNTNSPAAETQRSPLPKIDEIKLNVGTSAPELSIQFSLDGKVGSVIVKPESPWNVEAKDTVKLSYYKGLADTVRISLNGKKIETPLPPENWPKNGFDLEINKDNIRNILETGKISVDAPGRNAASPRDAVETASPAG
jgi:cytoskeletal protein RodZ